MSKRTRRASRPNPPDNKTIAKVERAIADSGSKQPRFTTTNRQVAFDSFYKWMKTTLGEEKPYNADSRERDTWLDTVWRKEPHIAGVIASVVSINANREWWLAGGRNQVSRYNNILRNVDGGAGWRQYMQQGSLSYYTGDMGFLTEVGRDGGPDGPMRDLFFLDHARCHLTGNPLTPLAYTPNGGKEQQWAPGDFFRVTTLPATDESYRRLGFCPLSRCLQILTVLTAIFEHDKEMLGAKAPRGLLLLQNISETQWIQAMTARAANLTQMERDYYGGVAVIAQEGVDQMDAKLVALSQLPANFNLETYTNLCMYGVALCFEYDQTEFWPVNAGVMGRGQETQIQHAKAAGKGGLSFILSYQDQIQRELPETLEYQFEQRDIAAELAEANVKKAWADVAATMFDKGNGVLTYEEARIFLADAGVIPQEWAQITDEVVAESSGEISEQQRAIRRSRPRSQQIEQREWALSEAFWRSAFRNPGEAIVRSNSSGKVQYLYGSGWDFLKEHRYHPMARSMAIEYGGYNPPVARSLFGQSFAGPWTVVSRASEILYDKDDVQITQADVDKAISDGGDRVGPEFADLLKA